VQIIDPGAANVQTALPAFDLLIPTSWNFKGTVNFGGGKGGCFADFFAVSWEATSADGSIAFQGAPNYSWQYTDDAVELRKLNDPAAGTSYRWCGRRLDASTGASTPEPRPIDRNSGGQGAVIRSEPP
jgi:hypothetical protein